MATMATTARQSICSWLRCTVLSCCNVVVCAEGFCPLIPPTKRLLSWFGGWAAVEGGDCFVAQNGVFLLRNSSRGLVVGLLSKAGIASSHETAVLLAMTGVGVSSIQSGARLERPSWAPWSFSQ